MRSTSARRWQAALWGALAHMERAFARGTVWAARLAVLILLLSGETLRHLADSEGLISPHQVRAVHVAAGFLLLGALLTRLGRWLVRLSTRLLQSDRRSRAPFNWQQRPDAVTVIRTAWWLVSLALVASGIERFLQLRHGAGVLAVLPPTAWWMLHQALLPLVYAILLIGLVVRGRLVLRKSLEHLHTP